MVMVDDSSDFACHIALLDIKFVMVDQSYFCYRFSIRELGPEFVVEVEIAVRDLAIFQVPHDL